MRVFALCSAARAYKDNRGMARDSGFIWRVILLLFFMRSTRRCLFDSSAMFVLH